MIESAFEIEVTFERCQPLLDSHSDQILSLVSFSVYWFFCSKRFFVLTIFNLYYIVLFISYCSENRFSRLGIKL